ncbi:MAG TPA: DUF1499 domain-containing protein [Gammaproteobacteria bacterium]|nr:DUF1499 domain-containing protein [Gammaproteobacteria bacterium]
MKISSMLIVILLIAGLTGFIFLSYSSRSKTPPGLVLSRLSHCPDKPNCVCSEENKNDSHDITPISLPPDISHATLIQRIISVLSDMGGSIISHNDSYVAATFTSPIFRFIDDFEIRIDHEKQRLHIRSASRLGYSDFGVNKKRAETFKSMFISANNANT